MRNMMSMREYNFDGLVGPTHNYAGLAYGNVASAHNRNRVANPQAAALQGLEKMKFVRELGIGQGFLPPVYRPVIPFLESLGFRGSRADVLAQAQAADPVLLSCAYSASSMWTANAATVSPAADTADQRTHLSVANLTSGLHRSLEAAGTWHNLKTVFADPSVFQVHGPLPGAAALSDEGAANHTRLHVAEGQAAAAQGIEIFVYGRDALDPQYAAPQKFPARQTLQASQAIARRHRLNPDRTLFWQQNPHAIDAGVFHNDVISVGNGPLLLCHELAFVEQQQKLDQLRQLMESLGGQLHVGQAQAGELSLDDCVTSYLFNSQLLTLPDGNMHLICPLEVDESPTAAKVAQRWQHELSPLQQVHFLDLRQSMRNGGGPACLRLRVALTPEQVQGVNPAFLMDSAREALLADWVRNNYRTEMSPEDLADPQLPDEIDRAFSELEALLELPPGGLRVHG